MNTISLGNRTGSHKKISKVYENKLRSSVCKPFSQEEIRNEE